MLIRRQNDLVELVDQLLRRGAVGFDTEFIRERRYFAQLCLVQVRAGAGADAVEALLDPFELNLEPLARLIADESVVKIVHAGAQDLQIFYQRYGLPPRCVFDTQIAGAFLGYGQQAGYADLVAQVEGGQPLSKASQFTDWAARPLSQAQMEYALGDVRHLHALYETLHRDLQARGRLEWAETEFRRAEQRASTPTAPDELYGKLNTSGLNRKQLAALRELAAQRDAIARGLDRPVGYVLPDAILVHVAKQQPATVSALRSTRGMSPTGSEYAEELLAALKRAAALSPEDLPAASSNERSSPQLTSVVGLLNVMAQASAAAHGIARAYLAPGEQVTALADWWLRHAHHPGVRPPQIPLLQDWRRDLLGADLLAILDGKLAVTFAPGIRTAARGEPAIRLLKVNE